MNRNTIQNKNFLVTGANRGIGRSFVEVFLENGAAKAYAAVRNPDSARPLVDRFGDRVQVLPIDLSDDASIRAAASLASDVDIVVNNAGVLKTTNVLDPAALDSLRFELDVNLFGLVRVAHAFAPVLEKRGGGAFVQLNSVVSMKSFPAFATYSASKAAAYSLTQALREDLGKKGIDVYSVHPGPIATDMGDSAGLTDIAEPAELVPRTTIEAIAEGRFHVFPDTMAKQIGEAYRAFAENVIEAAPMEA